MDRCFRSTLIRTFVGTLNRFSVAPFHNRCKPGLSHRGLGLELRQASSGACTQFRHLLANPLLAGVGIVSREGPVVEAFPNAFLGVLMPEAEMLAVPRLKRGHRFDWLYDQMVVTGRLQSLLSKGLDLPDTDAERSELLPSGQQAIFNNRVAWAKTYLNKAGLLKAPRRGAFIITDRGKSVLTQNSPKMRRLTRRFGVS
jgi:hypothetical protein